MAMKIDSNTKGKIIVKTVGKKVKTNDGSETFYNEEFGECYHSKSGAVEEAFKKFAKPSNIAELAKNQRVINILDVCFGLGYNSAAAIETIRKANPKCKIHIVALENDPAILKKLQTLKPELKYFDMIQSAVKKTSNGADNAVYNNDDVKVEIIVGDALDTIKQINTKFDVVFHDPFSPKKCPQLWTKEIFTTIYKLMNKNSVLCTYSCARVVRDNLKASGFVVYDGPIVGRRAPSTIAKKVER